MLNLGESLEALQAVVINAIWAADIEVCFSDFSANSHLDGNRFDRGVARFCELAALLRTASLFDRDPRAISLEKFLEFANDHVEQFKYATKEQIEASVIEHKNWIKNKEGLIMELKRYRDKQVAHLDISSVRDHFDGKIAGVTGILEPTIVEKSATLIEEIIEIVDVYTQYYKGETFDLKNMRKEIRENCNNYIQYRLSSHK